MPRPDRSLGTNRHMKASADGKPKAQRAPRAKNEVARPGGKVPGSPKIALVKVADGFNDPTNVASPNDGTGRIFVVERVGRVKIVDRNGQVLRLGGGVVGGLYAAGNTAANVFGWAYPSGGGTIGNGMVFGYLAGRHAGSQPARDI